MQRIYADMEHADVIVLASPVYFYTWNAAMKSVIDRTFAIKNRLKDKKFYLLCTCAGKKKIAIMLDCYHQYIDCFSNNTDGGYLVGYNLRKPGEINNNDIIEKEYEETFF